MGRSRNPRGRGHLPLSKDPVKGVAESLPAPTAEQAGLGHKVVGVDTAFMLRLQKLPSIDGSISATGDFASMPCFQTPRRLVALLASAVRLKRPTMPNLRGKARPRTPSTTASFAAGSFKSKAATFVTVYADVVPRSRGDGKCGPCPCLCVMQEFAVLPTGWVRLQRIVRDAVHSKSEPGH
jgi:hypothetical protein